MAQLTVRKVDAALVRLLKMRAAANGRSAEAEHRAIPQQALKPGSDDFWKRAAKLRRELKGKYLGDSTDIIREARDRLAGKFE
jgi:plasmid stability protein